MDDLTRQFLRFREHADVAALGAVFDASAGRLLSLALQLCGNPSDAEDLLQATFVLAMQKAPTFDASKPLLPWLCGILAGEASNLRRGAARHRSEPLPELIDDATGPLIAIVSVVLALLFNALFAMPLKQLPCSLRSQEWSCSWRC